MNSENYGLENSNNGINNVSTGDSYISWLSALENDFSESSIWDSVGSQSQ